MDAEPDLAQFLRLSRAGYRGEAILMTPAFAPGIRFCEKKARWRKSLQLHEETVESLRFKGIAEQKLIEVSPRSADGQAILKCEGQRRGHHSHGGAQAFCSPLLPDKRRGRPLAFAKLRAEKRRNA
jgi:hypothetical protein